MYPKKKRFTEYDLFIFVKHIIDYLQIEWINEIK